MTCTLNVHQLTSDGRFVLGGRTMIDKSERRFLSTLAQLTYCNPFQPERLELERQALGDQHQTEDYMAWSKDIRLEDSERPNVVLLTARAEDLVEKLHKKLRRGDAADSSALALYRDLVAYVLYYRHTAKLQVEPSLLSDRKSQQKLIKIWQDFLKEYHHYLQLPDRQFSSGEEPAHWFACFFQVRRAFRYIFDNILGDSRPAVELRAMVWQSVFTHDMRRYRRLLYDRMRGMTTLITGPSGTGKELVARAISLSQYIPFDPKREQFAGPLAQAFVPVNLSALSPTLVESELFGHCRGAFTGALGDRHGRLEICPSYGAVFLDEIGDLDLAIQVKLLRVAQNGTYSRIGESDERTFTGKLLAATNRDLAEEIRAGRFREDLYYRLCSDHVQTPSLRDHLQDNPETLKGMIAFISRRLVADEAAELTTEVETWIQQHLAADYPWPGNIRELEQCVRNVLIHKQYQPRSVAIAVAEQHRSKRWLADAERGTLSFANLLSHYCTWVYAKLGSYQRTAEALGIDRRTVRSKIDQELLKQIRDDS